MSFMTFADDGGRWWLAELRHSVELLASPAHVQITHLRRNGVHLDELALAFDAAFRPVTSPDERIVMSPAALTALSALDDLLSALDPDPALWTDEALATTPEWAEVRAAARRAGQALTP